MQGEPLLSSLLEVEASCWSSISVGLEVVSIMLSLTVVTRVGVQTQYWELKARLDNLSNRCSMITILVFRTTHDRRAELGLR